MPQYGVEIAGTGSYVPDRVLSNRDLERMVDTSDEWIVARTGIRERRIADKGEPTSALGAEAAKRALEKANVQAEDLDFIIAATLSPDTPFPNTGCHIQQRIGAPNAACFSIEAACSGFLYAVNIGADMIRCGTATNILVVAAEKMSTLVDWTDRNTCVLFGDGAGAVVLRKTTAGKDALLACKLGANGNFVDLLKVPAGGTAVPLNHKLLDRRMNCIHMSGREIFKLAVNVMSDTSEEVLQMAGMPKEEVRWLIPHQANTRIIKAVGKRIGIPEDRVFINVDRYGNTSAASIPVALDELERTDQLQQGDCLLMTAFGGGLTWGAGLLRW